MSMIASTKATKAESNQLIKQSVAAAESTSAEGSLLEEFSQILDKIADQLARGHKDSETIDLLAIEQTAERVQAQVNPPTQRLAESGAVRTDEVDGSTGAEDEGDKQSRADRSEMSGVKFTDEANEQFDQRTTQSGTNDGNADLGSFAQEAVNAQGEGSTEFQAADQATEGAVEVGPTSESEPEPVGMAVAVEGDLPPVAEQSVISSKRSMAAQHAESAGLKSSASSGAALTMGDQVSQIDQGAIEGSAVSEMTAALRPRATRDLVERGEMMAGGVHEKGVPFSTFMLQGNGFAGSGISRDTVAQAILRPALEGVLGRQVNEVAASGKGGAQSGMGGFNGDATMLRGAGGQVKNESSARSMKWLPRAVAARTLEKVEQALEEIARSKNGKTISLHLEPVNLGKVKVDVSLRDGNLHARLSADAVEVQQLLREHAHELQAILRKTGLHVDSVSVSVGSENETFESAADLPGRERFSEQTERDGTAESFQTPLETVESGRTAVVDDHWVA